MLSAMQGTPMRALAVVSRRVAPRAALRAWPGAARPGCDGCRFSLGRRPAPRSAWPGSAWAGVCLGGIAGRAPRLQMCSRKTWLPWPRPATARPGTPGSCLGGATACDTARLPRRRGKGRGPAGRAGDRAGLAPGSARGRPSRRFAERKRLTARWPRRAGAAGCGCRRARMRGIGLGPSSQAARPVPGPASAGVPRPRAQTSGRNRQMAVCAAIRHGPSSAATPPGAAAVPPRDGADRAPQMQGRRLCRRADHLDQAQAGEPSRSRGASTAHRASVPIAHPSASSPPRRKDGRCMATQTMQTPTGASTTWVF